MSEKQKITCDICRNLLLDYGWLDDATQNLVNAHLPACEACRKEQELLKEFAIGFQPEGIGEMDGKIDFSADIMAAVRPPAGRSGNIWLHAIGIFVVLELVMMYCLGTGITAGVDLLGTLYGSLAGMLIEFWTEAQGLVGAMASSSTGEYLPVALDYTLMVGGLAVFGIFIVFNALQRRKGIQHDI